MIVVDNSVCKTQEPESCLGAILAQLKNETDRIKNLNRVMDQHASLLHGEMATAEETPSDLALGPLLPSIREQLNQLELAIDVAFATFQRNKIA